MATKISAATSNLLYAVPNIPKPVSNDENVQSSQEEDLHEHNDALFNATTHTINHKIQKKKYLMNDFFSNANTTTPHIQRQTLIPNQTNNNNLSLSSSLIINQL